MWDQVGREVLENFVELMSVPFTSWLDKQDWPFQKKFRNMEAYKSHTTRPDDAKNWAPHFTAMLKKGENNPI